MRKGRDLTGLPAVLVIATYFAKCLAVQMLAIRLEERIVSETLSAAGWPYDRSWTFASEFFCGTIGLCQTKNSHKASLSLRGMSGTLGLELFMNILHCFAEILGRPCPTCRVDARVSIQCVDSQAGVIGERHESCSFGRGERFDACILLKRCSVFFRFIEVFVCSGDDLES